MKRANSHYKWLIPTLLVLVLAFFQNCSGGLDPFASSSQVKSKTSPNGNGGGYEGKVYVARSADSTCADGSDVSAKIEVSADKKAYLVRDNCTEQNPVELPYDSVNLMEHNLNNLIHNARVFDEAVLATQERTATLCRGSEIDATTGNNKVVDVLIQQKTVAGTVSLFGHTVFGIYKPDGSLDKKFDLGEVPVSGPFMSGDQETYWSKTVLAGEVFTLRIRPVGTDLIGNVVYTDNLSAPGSHLGPLANATQYEISHLKCYRQ